MEDKIYCINDLELKQHTFILICSKRNSGKSVLCRHLIYYFVNKYNYDFIVLFSNTAGFNGDYDFLENNNIFKFDKFEDKIKAILKYQEDNRKKNKKVNGLILLDDIPLYKTSNMLQN